MNEGNLVSKMKIARKQISFIETCYRLYEQKMYHVAYSILHDEGLAEDAVQEAFLKLMNHDQIFESADSDDCKRYIITIIRNASINIYNKRKRESEVIYLTDNDERAEATVEMHPNLDDDWKALLKGLPEKYYDVVYYLVIEEFTTKETAEKLNISEANVRKRFERARQMLRKSSTVRLQKELYYE